jgi:hypothetical protein
MRRPASWHHGGAEPPPPAVVVVVLGEGDAADDEERLAGGLAVTSAVPADGVEVVDTATTCPGEAQPPTVSASATTVSANPRIRTAQQSIDTAVIIVGLD